MEKKKEPYFTQLFTLAVMMHTMMEDNLFSWKPQEVKSKCYPLVTQLNLTAAQTSYVKIPLRYIKWSLTGRMRVIKMNIFILRLFQCPTPTIFLNPLTMISSSIWRSKTLRISKTLIQRERNCGPSKPDMVYTTGLLTYIRLYYSLNHRIANSILNLNIVLHLSKHWFAALLAH